MTDKILYGISGGHHLAHTYPPLLIIILSPALPGLIASATPFMGAFRTQSC